MCKKLLGQAFKSRMKEKGLTLRSLGRQIGMSDKSLFYKLNSGSFEFEEVLKLMEFFDVSLETLKKEMEYKPLEIKEWSNS